MFIIKIHQEAGTETSIETGEVEVREFTFNASTEKLHQVLGRFMIKYGTPLSIDDDREGWHIFEFFTEKNGAFFSCDVWFKEVSVTKLKTVVPVIENEKIQILEKEGILVRR